MLSSIACSRSVLCVGNRYPEALPEPDKFGVQLLRSDICITTRQEGVMEQDCARTCREACPPSRCTPRPPPGSFAAPYHKRYQLS